MKLTSKTRPR